MGRKMFRCTPFIFPATNLKSCYSNCPVLAGNDSLELREIPGEDCQIIRYGYFKATITIIGKTSRGKRVESTRGHPPTLLALKGWGWGAGHPPSVQGAGA